MIIQNITEYGVTCLNKLNAITYANKDISYKLQEYIKGLKKGVPIGLGYISVSFTFGMMVVTGGLSPYVALIISMTNLTSAGQFAGLGLIFNHASYLEIALTTFVINLRYMLMSLSLSQKLDPSINLLKRGIMAFGVTDETFTVASLEKETLTSGYMFGLITMPYIGWALGTYIGAVATTFLSNDLRNSLGIALYAMFIALIIPEMKKSKPILLVVVIAVAFSCIFKYVPYICKISSGFAVIICTILAAGTAAYFFPIKEDK